MKKQELLKKIEELFYFKTFKEVSMQDIANELWMKKASLYYYFPSKEDILKEVIEDSFKDFLDFIQDLIDIWWKNTENEKVLKKLIKDFVIYPESSKNLFSIINQNWYCDNNEIIEIITNKEKIIFDNISLKFKEILWFSNEKTFLFMSVLHDIWRKKCIYWKCNIDIDLIIDELYNIFFKK